METFPETWEGWLTWVAMSTVIQMMNYLPQIKASIEAYFAMRAKRLMTSESLKLKRIEKKIEDLNDGADHDSDKWNDAGETVSLDDISAEASREEATGLESKPGGG